MPFLFQHQVVVGMNPITVVIGSPIALPIKGKHVRVIELRAVELFDEKLEDALPPLRAINHTIPLKDPNKIYS